MAKGQTVAEPRGYVVTRIREDLVVHLQKPPVVPDPPIEGPFPPPPPTQRIQRPK